MIGFLSYLYKLIKTEQIKIKVVKILIISFIVFSLISTFIEEEPYFKSFSIEKHELNNLIIYSKFTNSSNVLILEFGWEYPIIYYEYPYGEKEVYPFDLFDYIFVEEKFIDPDLHFLHLEELEDTHNAEVYILLTDYYTSLSGWENFGSVSKDKILRYFNLSYLSRICSTKTIDGMDKPIYLLF
jgi:hypothetical protein